MSEFKREERFIVIKRKHLYSESRVHESLEQELRVWLDKHLIPTSECVVVESDWPEYEQIWRMIEARVTGQLSDYERLEAENKALREELSALRSRVGVVPDGATDLRWHPEFNRGWNACLNELARLNGKTVSEGLLRRILDYMGRYMCSDCNDQSCCMEGYRNAMKELSHLLDEGKEDGNGQ